MTVQQNTTSAAPASRDTTSTHWAAVAIIVCSGVVAAFQVGKAVIAVPALRIDLGLDLTQAAWVMATFALLGVVGGIPAGAAVNRYGARRLLLIGLLAVAAGSAAGGLADGFATLLLTRVLEGLGVVLITIAAPALLRSVISPRDRDLAFGLWSSYMPLGMAIILAMGGLSASWRGLWWGIAALAAAAAVAVMLAVPAPQRSGEATSWRAVASGASRTLRNPGSALIAATFAAYTLQYFAVFSFLPVLLIERLQLSVAAAGGFTSAAAAANALGTMTAGILLGRRLVSRWRLIAFASIVMGVCGAMVFTLDLPTPVALALCILFAGVGGILPSTLLGSAPLLAPVPALAPMAIGLAMQGSNLGQVLGPLAVGFAVQAQGWPAAAVIVVLAAVLSVTLACRLRPVFARAGA